MVALAGRFKMAGILACLRTDREMVEPDGIEPTTS
jgi:hypothetical protein